jgi:HPt (histidine-containing phosphotransfer) domain-containing protein
MTNPENLTDIYDKQEVLGRLDGDEELAQEIVELFQNDAPQQLATLHAVLAKADFGTAQKIAHSLKGASANVGLKAFYRGALALEQALKKGENASIAGLLQALDYEFERVQKLFAATGPT